MRVMLRTCRMIISFSYAMIVDFLSFFVVFSRMSLEEIMRQVYRWYGVETVFSDETVRAVTFTGVIDKSMPLEELFKVIETLVDVRFVMDENNQVVITAK